MGAIAETGLAIMQQLPGQTEQLAGGLQRIGLFLIRGAFQHLGIDTDRKAMLEISARLLPSGDGLTGLRHAQGGIEQRLAPEGQFCLGASCPLPKQSGRQI